MQAIIVSRADRAPRVVDLPKPRPGPGEALVRTLRVGVDGTDHEVIRGGHGGFPPDDDHMILGHEAVGVVEEISTGNRTPSGDVVEGPNATDLEPGQIVTPTVRRPPNGANEYFERGEPDMAPGGQYVERGIEGGHGFMSEYFTSPTEYLVPIPDDLAPLGFLVEPVSISEKAFELAYSARSSFDWSPESGLVLGNGSLGLLTLAMLEASGYDRTYCLGRRDRPDPTIDIIESLGATYIDSRETPVADIPDEHEPMDFVYEATGYAPHAFDTIRALAPNGVGALLGVPESGWAFEVSGSDLHREVVLENKALIGSVNSHVDHFEAAVDTLRSLPGWLFDDIISGIYGLDEFEQAFLDDENTIKTAVQFSSYEER